MIHFQVILLLTISSAVAETRQDVYIQAKRTSLGRHKELGVNYGNFKAHENSRLMVGKVRSFNTQIVLPHFLLLLLK